jgi:hypothetical protein
VGSEFLPDLLLVLNLDGSRVSLAQGTKGSHSSCKGKCGVTLLVVSSSGLPIPVCGQINSCVRNTHLQVRNLPRLA